MSLYAFSLLLSGFLLIPIAAVAIVSPTITPVTLAQTAHLQQRNWITATVVTTAAVYSINSGPLTAILTCAGIALSVATSWRTAFDLTQNINPLAVAYSRAILFVTPCAGVAFLT